MPRLEPDDLVDIAELALEEGFHCPFEAPDPPADVLPGEFYLSLAPTDWAHVAARGIFEDLSNRAGVIALESGDDYSAEFRLELIEVAAEIIRRAHQHFA